MDFIQFFKSAVLRLRRDKVRFALAGGLIASIYRSEERLTSDLDFLLFSESRSLSCAEKIIRSFKLTPHIIRQADLEGGPMFAIKRKSTKPFMVCGRAREGKTSIGLDFILPSFPWFEEALKRAEVNQIDFGLGKPVPALTVEDVIISKLYALKNNAHRFKDLDDLQSIFQVGHDLDMTYLSGQMMALQLVIPKELKLVAPAVLRKIRLDAGKMEV
jgi:hypothetical protein